MKHTFLYILFVLAISATQTSCDKKEEVVETGYVDDTDVKIVPGLKLNAVDYKNWVEDPFNGMFKTKKIGNLRYDVFYKTADYLAIKEIGEDSLTAQEINKRKTQYNDMEYFTFKIQSLTDQQELLRVGIKSEDEYYARLEYFSYKMQNDFKLIRGIDTLDCALYHYERVYGLANHASVVLGFPKPTKAKGNIYLIYNDKVFNNGNVILSFKEEILNNIPKIEI